MESNKKAAIVNMDIIVEILSRLCAKDLIRFKSVCKHWFQVISSKLFIKLHLNNSRFNVPHLETSYFIGSPPHRNFLIHPQPQCQNTVLFVGNSCDGLICLLNRKSGFIHIWNPSIRQSACFPIKKRIPNNQVVCFWFGIHDDEYKLVLGTGPDAWNYWDVEYQMHLMRPDVDCHSYKTTTQVLGAKDNYQDFYYRQGTLFGGNAHWPVIQRLFSCVIYILCYNLREGKVGRINLPATANRVRHVELGEIDGCFSALFLAKSMRYEVWVMKEYGVEGSWTKLMFLDYGIRTIFKSVSPEKCVESLVPPNEGACCHNGSFCCCE